MCRHDGEVLDQQPRALDGVAHAVHFVSGREQLLYEVDPVLPVRARDERSLSHETLR
jgi:hypothetical protein